MKESNIKISIIMPIYNMEKYLRCSLNSVVKQDLADMEIICINDGSTDSSLAILKHYHEKDKRFVIINQRNRGVANSRNLGIRRAVGKYVAFLDPDDFLPDGDIMSKLYKAAEDNDVVIAGGEFSDIDKSGKINYQYSGTLAGYTFKKEGIIYYSDYQFDYGYHRFIYNRKFLIRHRLFFPQLLRFQDPPFMIQTFTLAEKFFAIKKVTYCYRMDYRLIHWDKKKVEDLLTGLRMNIKWAERYQFMDLLKLTLKRMADEYFEVIMAQFLREADIRNIVYGIINEQLIFRNEIIMNFNVL